MAKLRIVLYDSDHKMESSPQASSAPPDGVQKDNRHVASSTGAGSSAGPTVKHGVGKGLMVQKSLLAESKKAALERGAREDKKREKKGVEEKKRKKKDTEVGGNFIEPQKKKSRTDEGMNPSEPPAETSIVSVGEKSMVVVDVRDSPAPVSMRFDFSFQFKGDGKHIVEVPQQCSAFV